MKNIPPELLGEIINHLPSHDQKSLRNCSLVAKSWIYPARRRLFEYISIGGDSDRLRSWLNTISPTNVGLLQHVRRLDCQIPDVPDLLHGSGDTVDLFRDYPPSLSRLQHLLLWSGCLASLTQIWTPSAFQNSLSSLSLWGCRVSAGMLVTFLNYFPNLARLDLVAITHNPDGQRIPPLSRMLQKLTVAGFHPENGLDLLDQLMVLRPQCEGVAIGRFVSCPLLAQRIVNGVEASVKRLNIKSDLVCAYKISNIIL